MSVWLCLFCTSWQSGRLVIGVASEIGILLTRLIHWGLVTHICVSKRSIIVPVNGLLPKALSPSAFWNQFQCNLNRNEILFFGEIDLNAFNKMSVICPQTSMCRWSNNTCVHDDVINWKHFPRYWPFMRWIHRLPVNSTHKGQWRGAFMFSLICAWINGWVNNREAVDLRRYRAYFGVTVVCNRSIVSDISNLIFLWIEYRNTLCELVSVPR